MIISKAEIYRRTLTRPAIYYHGGDIFADSVIAEIISNFESYFNGETVNYSGEDRQITAERERYNNIIDGRFPFVLLLNPVVEVLSRAHRVSNCMLHCLVTFMDDTINDNYSNTSTVDPITKVTENVAADLIKIAMETQTKRTCGGYALNTEWSEYGHYFDFDGKQIVFNVYVQFDIRAFIRTVDPYLIG